MSGETDYDVVVVGAGPAGLSAAVTLAAGGAGVLVVDEQQEPGGQIYRSVERNARRPDRALLGPDYFHGAGLVKAFRDSAAAYMPGTMAVNIENGHTLWLLAGQSLRTVSARHVLLATGAMERPVPVPGWTLPGVVTAGAIQILLKRDGLVPSEPLALVGSGPLFYLLAQQCIAAGANIAAIVDTASRANWRKAAMHMPLAFTGKGPSYLLKGARMMAAIRRSRVPFYANAKDVRIEGDERVRSVSFRQGGRAVEIPVAMVALHEGVIPAQQMSRASGCAQRWDGMQQGFHPVLDEWGNSSVAGLSVAGDAAGISGARAAEHQGRLAACGILHRLGRIDVARREELARPSRRDLARHRSVRGFLDALYRPRGEIMIPADDTVVCRCEEIAVGAVRGLARKGLGPNQIKSALRCGMGPCQGRICGPSVNAIAAEASSRTPDAVGYFNIRPPVKPIELGALLDMPDGNA